MPTLILSVHARQMIARRGLAIEWVVATVELPARTEPDPVDPTLVRSYRAIPEAGGRVLRVVHRPARDGSVVVTAHFDRSAGP